jgi:hypothetical protein
VRENIIDVHCFISYSNSDGLNFVRKIIFHKGAATPVLRLFDELVKCDEEGILKDVRNAVEGKE